MVRRIPPDERWRALMEEAATEEATSGIYESEEHWKAALDPNLHDALWVPNQKNYLRAILGAFSETGELVGSVGLYQREDDLVGVLEGLFVRKAERSRGHATRLVRVAIDEAKDWGIETMEIFTLEGDEKAFGFWRKLLNRPPNAESSVTFTDFPPKRATGWRLKINDIAV